MTKWLSHGKFTALLQHSANAQRTFAHNLRLLNGIGNDVALNDDKRTELALQVVLTEFRLDQGYLGVVDESTNELVMQNVVARQCEPTYGVGKRYNLGQTLLGQVVDGAALFTAPDVGKARAQHRIELADEWKSFIAMPIRLGGRRYGAIGFKGRTAREHPFSSIDDEFVHVTSELIAATIHRQRHEQRLRLLAFTDVLTGLPNRTSLAETVAESIATAADAGTGFTVTYVDLDGFKLVNDTLGHAVGDAVLREFAQRLANAVRQGDTVARLGGDEFVIVMPDLANAAQAAEIAARMVRHAGRPIRIEGHDIAVSASVGVSVFPDDGADARTLLAHADAAMYQAKRSDSRRDPYRTGQMRANASS